MLVKKIGIIKKIILRTIFLLKIDKEFILISSCYLAVCLIIRCFYGVKKEVLLKIMAFWASYSLISFIAFNLYYIIIIRPQKPFTCAIKDLHKVGIERVIAFFFVLLCLAITMVSFMSFKPLIPVIHPFCWDSIFARLDNLIHGRDPWQIIHPMLSSKFAIQVLMLAYCFYFFFIFAGAIWQIAAPIDSHLRKQFLLSFVLCWILLGNIMAVIFSSAGPCFYHYVAKDSDRFSYLTTYLSSSGYLSMIAKNQANLWYNYRHSIYDYVFSISAMPSMHISLPFLLVLSTKNRTLKTGAIILTILVSLACVYFGYHYAVDIYAAILGTWLIWKLVGLYVRKFPPIEYRIDTLS